MTLNARPRRLGYRKKKRGGPKLVFVQYGFCRESKRRAGTRIYIGYALESWRQLQLERSRAGLADGCSYPNGRRVTIEAYLLILPYVPLTVADVTWLSLSLSLFPFILSSCLHGVEFYAPDALHSTSVAYRPIWASMGATSRDRSQFKRT